MASILNSYSILSYLLKKYVWYSRDGASSYFLPYLYFFPCICLPYFLVFHSWHSGDGANSTIFILFPSFSYYLLSLSIVILQNLHAWKTGVDFRLTLLHCYPIYWLKILIEFVPFLFVSKYILHIFFTFCCFRRTLCFNKTR